MDHALRVQVDKGFEGFDNGLNPYSIGPCSPRVAVLSSTIIGIVVLILILLDHALRVIQMQLANAAKAVLILILLDHALREQKC